MNPIDRLCELLDERDVEYERIVSGELNRIEWVRWKGVGGLEFSAIRSNRKPDMLYFNDTCVLPEVAVEVTIPTERTCDMRWDDDCDEYPQGRWWLCEGCGERFLYERGFRPAYCPECGCKRKLT